jgi:AcrR family transcriptional regulator
MVSKKEKILKAAALLFSEKGYKDASMAELSKMTGAAEGTIFYHFKSKEELFLSILAATKSEIVKESNRYLGERKFANGLDMVEGSIAFYLHLVSTMEERFLLLHRHYPYELAQTNSICRGYLEEIYNCFVDIFERAILFGQEDGSIDKRDSRKVALIVFSMVDGLVRFRTYNLYDPSALYAELIHSCRKMLSNNLT